MAEVCGARTVVSIDVGTRNFAICVLRAAPGSAEKLAIAHWEVIDTIVEHGLPARTTIEQKKNALLQSLCSRRHLFDGLGAGDSVVIEQQPFGRGKGSSTMNVMAHVIAAFFTLLDPAAAPAYSVAQVPARQKLKVRAECFGGAPIVEAAPDVGSRVFRFALPQSGAAAVDWKAYYERVKPAYVYVQPDAASGVVVFKRARKCLPTVSGQIHKACTVTPQATEFTRPPPPRGAEYGKLPTSKKRKRHTDHARYRRNKVYSIDTCASVLAGTIGAANADYVSMFHDSGKQDDLADAFTQALSVLE